jgi:hypothetical protein
MSEKVGFLSNKYSVIEGGIVDMRWRNGRLQAGRMATRYENGVGMVREVDWTDVRDEHDPPAATPAVHEQGGRGE